jgi:hypothetical protein
MSATVKKEGQEIGMGLKLSGASLELKKAPLGKPPR